MGPVFYSAYHNFVYSFISLFSIVNPIGMAAVFLSFTQNYPVLQRRNMAWHVALYSSILLIVAFFLGTVILRFFGISLGALQIVGGLLTFDAAWHMLMPAPLLQLPHKAIPQPKNSARSDIAFFPLTMPLTVGAAEMSIAVALAARLNQAGNENYIVSYISAVLGIGAVCVTIGVCYSFADQILKKFGKIGTQVITRLSAYILLAIGVTVAWDGVKALILMPPG